MPFTKSLLKKIPHIDKLLGKINYSYSRSLENTRALNSVMSTLDSLRSNIEKTVQENLSLKNSLSKYYEELSFHYIELSDKVADLKSAKSRNHAKEEVKNSPVSFAQNHSLDKFYLQFENKFRGEESLIEKRLKIYLPYFSKSKLDFKKTPALDLGCGRGEMLELLKKKEINCIGVDLNGSMIEQAKRKGHKAVAADAISYLKKQRTGSIGAITGFHLVEHIPFENLVILFEECQRVLTKDGFIIFETPNPENLLVATHNFYLDPSHLKPLPPALIEFLSLHAGLRKVEITRQHLGKDIKKPEDLEKSTLSPYEKHISYFQDYAVIAYK